MDLNDLSSSDWLDKHNVGYYSEKELKIQGYDKTPDFLLTVPVIVHNVDESGQPQPMLVQWIESKAMFGDRETVVGHYKDQLEPYFQRFGSGLIIYFKGCIEEIRVQFSTQSLKMVTELPQSVTQHSCSQ